MKTSSSAYPGSSLSSLFGRGSQLISLLLLGAGAALAQNSLLLLPPSLTFGPQNTGTTSVEQTSILVNITPQTVSFSSIALTGTDAADFIISANVCSAALSSFGACYVSVNFKPTAPGTRSAALTFATNAGSSQSVALSGTGIGAALTPNIVFSPPSAAFGTQNIGLTTTATLGLLNNGTAAATFTSFTIGGANSRDFSITGNTCGASLAINAKCSISISFTPSVAAAETASLVVIDNGTGSPQSVALSGTGQPVTAHLVFSPPAVAFGAQNDGTTSTAGVSLLNNGNAAAAFTSFAITGANAKDFAISANTCATSLAVHATCTVTLSFTPTTAAAESASLVVTGNQAGSPQSVAISGSGQAAARLVFSPPSVSFGTQNEGTTGTLGVSIYNLGNAAATITSFAISGANAKDFAITTNTCTSGIAINAQCSFSLSFTPTTTAAETASLVVTGNQTGSPQAVTITGTGQAARASLVFSPPSVAFGTQNEGTTGTAGVTILNTGNAAATINSFTISGANAKDFAITANTCTSGIAIHAQCSVTLSFTPTTTAAESASLVVTGNQSGSPQSVSLTGTGQAVIAQR